jgi:hypothetical protein
MLTEYEFQQWMPTSGRVSQSSVGSTSVESWGFQNFADCQLGDKRLNQRALLIGKPLVVGFGQALSIIFKEEDPLKRAYEFFANPKAQLNKLTQPDRENTASVAQNLEVVLAVGDTTYLDYKNIKAKREGYGPIGNGGNGLIVHTTLAVEPLQGQSIGLLWHKLWHRQPKAKPRLLCLAPSLRRFRSDVS